MATTALAATLASCSDRPGWYLAYETLQPGFGSDDKLPTSCARIEGTPDDIAKEYEETRGITIGPDREGRALVLVDIIGSSWAPVHQVALASSPELCRAFVAQVQRGIERQLPAHRQTGLEGFGELLRAFHAELNRARKEGFEMPEHSAAG